MILVWAFEAKLLSRKPRASGDDPLRMERIMPRYK